MATGDAGGLIKIWQLSDDLTTQAANETDILEEIAGVALQTW